MIDPSQEVRECAKSLSVNLLNEVPGLEIQELYRKNMNEAGYEKIRGMVEKAGKSNNKY